MFKKRIAAPKTSTESTSTPAPSKKEKKAKKKGKLGRILLTICFVILGLAIASPIVSPLLYRVAVASPDDATEKSPTYTIVSVVDEDTVIMQGDESGETFTVCIFGIKATTEFLEQYVGHHFTVEIEEAYTTEDVLGCYLWDSFDNSMIQLNWLANHEVELNIPSDAEYFCAFQDTWAHEEYIID
jgi:hypothetical protein